MNEMLRQNEYGRWVPAEPLPESFGVLWGRLWHERRRHGEPKWVALFTSWRDARSIDCLVPLCGSGTSGCHGRVEARDPAALHSLAASLTSAEYAYVIGKLGEGALDRLFGVGVAR